MGGAERGWGKIKIPISPKTWEKWGTRLGTRYENL